MRTQEAPDLDVPEQYAGKQRPVEKPGKLGGSGGHETTQTRQLSSRARIAGPLWAPQMQVACL